MTDLRPFVIADHLRTEEDAAEYFAAIWESGNPEAIVAALGDIASAKDGSRLLPNSGLAEDTLRMALQPGSDPSFDTIYRIMRALDINLRAVVENV